MKQIRRNVFETNSSSVHSFTIDGSATNNIKLDKEGVISIRLRRFNGEEEHIEDSYTKLQFLIETILYINGILVPYHSHYGFKSGKCCWAEDITDEIVEEWSGAIDDLQNTADWGRLLKELDRYYTSNKQHFGGIKIDLSYGEIDHQSQEYESVGEMLSEAGCASMTDFIFGVAAIHATHD